MTHIDLSGLKILLTGASQGIGKVTAAYLMKMGAQVAVHYNSSKESAEDLVAAYKATNSKIFKADLDKEDEVVTLFDTVKKEFGVIDVVILNASFTLSEFDSFK